MPTGYKTVSIKEQIHEKIQTLARKTHRTVPGLLTHIFTTHRDEVEKMVQAEG